MATFGLDGVRFEEINFAEASRRALKFAEDRAKEDRFGSDPVELVSLVRESTSIWRLGYERVDDIPRVVYYKVLNEVA